MPARSKETWQINKQSPFQTMYNRPALTFPSGRCDWPSGKMKPNSLKTVICNVSLLIRMIGLTSRTNHTKYEIDEQF